MWAVHGVHHRPNEFNYSVSLSQGALQVEYSIFLIMFSDGLSFLSMLSLLSSFLSNYTFSSIPLQRFTASLLTQDYLVAWDI